MSRILLIIIISFCAFQLNAQSKITPYSKAVLKSHLCSPDSSSSLRIKPVKRSGSSLIPSILTLRSNCTSELSRLGIEIQNVSGNIATALIPINQFENVANIDEVASISVARRVNLCNDKARELSFINPMHNASPSLSPFTGKDVIVGIIDSGIDFNHINFRDADGNSRVVRAYLPHVNTGKRPFVDGYQLTGSEYTTPEEIASLSTDFSLESHGTHTTGTAAGSYSSNGFHGAAPASDLVLCGLDSLLLDTDVINSVAYVFNYASSVNKPAVVNLSLSSHQGAHDGSSPQCRALDNLADKGKIIVVAASNDALSTLYLHKKFSADDYELSSILFNNFSSEPANYKDCLIDTWSRDNRRLGVRFSVIAFSPDSQLGLNLGDVLATSPLFFPDNDSDNEFAWSSASDSNLAKYFNGKIEVFAGIDSSNGKFNLISSLNLQPTKPRGYLITMTIMGDDGTEFDTWEVDTRLHFGDFGLNGYVSGSGDVSISDMATGFNSISVGAYTSRLYYTSLSGASLSLYGDKAIEQDIAPFSSYGIDINGRPHPDVAAPGSSVISSFNSFDASSTPSDRGCFRLEDTANNKEYIWGAMDGTSMSTPLVAGTIAAWLQANPNLSADNIRDIIYESSYNDSFSLSGNPVRWGAGKLDAYSGLLKAIEMSSVSSNLLQPSPIKVFPNPSNGNFTLFMPCGQPEIDILIFSCNGRLLSQTHCVSADCASFNVNLGSSLSDGLYILKAVSDKTCASSALLIRK